MAEHTFSNKASLVLTNVGKLLPDLEALYKDIHGTWKFLQGFMQAYEAWIIANSEA